ncbi:calcium-binding protein SPEC 2C-like [Tubulanus polymorphus]|uniref:calcium-binding protein SPEC 2C-like n=1 Tax=Tubulanus polymorphus TaxID=672921 RepID=UPI003DA51C9B
MADSKTMLDMLEKVCKKYQITEVSSNLRSAFNTFVSTDKNGDGTLDKEEIESLKLGEKTNKEIFTKADGDTTETITLQELFKFIFLPNIKQYWKTLFNALDTNNSGYIEADEMETYLVACGFVGAETEDAMGVIRNYDYNNDKKLSFEEFSEFLEDDFDRLMNDLVPAALNRELTFIAEN